MPDESNGISILNERILAGDSFIDGNEHLLFAQQLQQMPELYSLSLNQLTNGYRPIYLASEISLSIRRL